MRLGQTWKVATWENTLGKLILGKIPLGKYLTYFYSNGGGGLAVHSLYMMLISKFSILWLVFQ